MPRATPIGSSWSQHEGPGAPLDVEPPSLAPSTPAGPVIWDPVPTVVTLGLK